MTLAINRILAADRFGTEVWMTPAQAQALESLTEIQHGGCAALHGYQPTTGYEVPPVVNIQMITGFSYISLIKRKRDQLEAISFSDVQEYVEQDELLSRMTLEAQNELFETRKAFELASIDRTLSGDRSDAHRQAHERCYVRFGSGIKGHLVTEKDDDGHKQPVMLGGFPVLDKIMVEFLELNRTVVQEGVLKPPRNSKAPVRMSNCIKRVLNQRSVGYKVASLGEGNFEKLVVSKKEINPEEVAPNILEVLND